MALHFGQTLFGAAVGLVSAAGVAACLSSASGHIEVRKETHGLPVEATAQVVGSSIKTTLGYPDAAHAACLVQANPKVDWRIAGTAQAVCSVSGSAKADFFPTGIGYITCNVSGTPYRLAKVRSRVAKGEAILEGEAQLYSLLYPRECRVTSSLYGTTNHLVYGQATVSATVSGTITWEAGVSGEALASATAEGTVHYTRAFYVPVYGDALLQGSLTHTKNGVNYHDLVGEAVVSCEAHNTHVVIYQSATVWATAECSGYLQYRVGVKGHAAVKAIVKGTMIGASTAVTLTESRGESPSTGNLRAHFKLKGADVLGAQCSGTVLHTETGIQGHAQAQGAVSGTVKAVSTKAYPDNAYGSAQVSGYIHRIRSMSGSPVYGEAVVRGYPQRKHHIFGVSRGTGSLFGTAFRTVFYAGQCAVAGHAALQNMQFSLFPAELTAGAIVDGHPQRDTFLAGSLEPVALVSGSVQINDVIQAPGSRTVVMTVEARTVPVPLESRTVIV